MVDISVKKQIKVIDSRGNAIPLNTLNPVEPHQLESNSMQRHDTHE